MNTERHDEAHGEYTERRRADSPPVVGHVDPAAIARAVRLMRGASVPGSRAWHVTARRVRHDRNDRNS
jgi:hypothetical protein